MQDKAIIVDLGATKILTGIASLEGHILATVKYPTKSTRSSAEIIDDIGRSIKQLIIEVGCQTQQIKGIAVCCPGPLKYPEGIILESPNLGWSQLNIKAILEERYQVPVLVDKDTNFAAWGEYWFGQNRRYQHLLYLTVSTGIGAGLVLGGHIYRGGMEELVK